MRILHVIESLEFGGAEKVLVDLANEFAKQQHAVTILCLKRIGALRAALDARVEVECLHLSEGSHYLLPWRLARLVKASDYDVVHAHTWGVLYETALGGLLAKTPAVVFTSHGNYPPAGHSLLRRLKRYARHALERQVLRRIDMTVPVSNAIKTEIATWAPETKIQTIHNGIEVLPLVEPPGRPLRGNVFRIITVGRLAPVKNHTLLLEAVADLRRETAIQLDILGDGPERAALEKLAQSLGIAAHVRFLGFRNDVRAYLAHADAFVITSDYEGISIAILEAMRAGLPVVATDVGGIRETVIDGETGIVVPPRARRELINALRALATDTARRKALGEAAYAFFARDFSLAHMVGRYRDLYTRLLAARGRAP